MNDLISRQAAIDAVETIGFDLTESDLSEIEKEEVCEIVGDMREDMIRMLRKVKPADVIPVVRCKDCKYNVTTHKCLNPDSFFLIPKDDDFCSFGERKE